MESIRRDEFVELEARIQQLEGRIDGILGVLAALEPVGKLLARCGAHE